MEHLHLNSEAQGRVYCSGDYMYDMRAMGVPDKVLYKGQLIENASLLNCLYLYYLDHKSDAFSE